MLRAKLNFFIGILFILAAVLVPSPALVEILREKPVSAELWEQLVVGASIFRIGLVVLGILIVTFWRNSFLKSTTLPQESNYGSNRKIVVISLSAILLTALALRIYGLGYGLWYDEIRTYVSYMSMPLGQILTTFDSENNHVLFTLLARVCFGFLGPKTWAIRLPAVFFGVGSIWALYLLARKVSSAREALLSAALLSFSYHHIWFSQNARGYTGLLFWTILSSWLFLQGLSHAEPKFWLLYAISAALGVYTHVTMVFVVVGQFIIYLITPFFQRQVIWPKWWKGFLFGFCLSGLLTLQLYSFILPQFLNTIGMKANVPTWENPFWTLFEIAKGMQIGFAGSTVALGALLLVGAGMFSYARENPVVLGLLFIPALIGSVLVISMGHPLWPRFFFFTMGFGILVVVRGTTVLGQAMNKLLNLDFTRWAFWGTAICSSLIIASMIALPRAYDPKQDYEGALAFVNQYKQQGDVVVTIGLTRFPYRSFYKTDWEEVETAEKLHDILRQSNRTLLLYTLPLHIQGEYPDIMNIIENNFEIVEQFYGTLNGGTIFVCRSKTSTT